MSPFVIVGALGAINICLAGWMWLRTARLAANVDELANLLTRLASAFSDAHGNPPPDGR